MIWIVEIPSWSIAVEAEDEGDALMQAEEAFSFMSEATAEEQDSE